MLENDLSTINQSRRTRVKTLTSYLCSNPRFLGTAKIVAFERSGLY